MQARQGPTEQAQQVAEAQWQITAEMRHTAEQMRTATDQYRQLFAYWDAVDAWRRQSREVQPQAADLLRQAAQLREVAAVLCQTAAECRRTATALCQRAREHVQQQCVLAK